MSFIQIASIPQKQIIHNWENASKLYFPAAFKGEDYRREAWMEIVLGECCVVKRDKCVFIFVSSLLDRIESHICSSFKWQKQQNQQKFE